MHVFIIYKHMCTIKQMSIYIHIYIYMYGIHMQRKPICVQFIYDDAYVNHTPFKHVLNILTYLRMFAPPKYDVTETCTQSDKLLNNT